MYRGSGIFRCTKGCLLIRLGMEGSPYASFDERGVAEAGQRTKVEGCSLAILLHFFRLWAGCLGRTCSVHALTWGAMESRCSVAEVIISGWLGLGTTLGRGPRAFIFRLIVFRSSFMHACMNCRSHCWRWRSREVNSVLVFSCSKRCWQDLLNSLLSPASGDNYHSLMNGRV